MCGGRTQLKSLAGKVLRPSFQLKIPQASSHKTKLQLSEVPLDQKNKRTDDMNFKNLLYLSYKKIYVHNLLNKGNLKDWNIMMISS